MLTIKRTGNDRAILTEDGYSSAYGMYIVGRGRYKVSVSCLEGDTDAVLIERAGLAIARRREGSSVGRREFSRRYPSEGSRVLVMDVVVHPVSK